MTVASVNDRVRVGPGVNGTVVVLGAWCAKCDREVIPTSNGFCAWGCGTFVVDEDTLSSSEMLAQLRALPEREPKAREETADAGSPPGAVDGLSPVSVHSESGGRPCRAETVSRSGNAPRRRKKMGRKPKWARATITAALTAFHAEHGRSPALADRLTADLPGWKAAARVFGGWDAALLAAGLPPTRKGRPPKTSGGAVGDLAVTGSADITTTTGPVKDAADVPPCDAAPLPVQPHPEAPTTTFDPGGASLDLQAVRAAALTAVNAVFDLLEATEQACKA